MFFTAVVGVAILSAFHFFLGPASRPQRQFDDEAPMQSVSRIASSQDNSAAPPNSHNINDVGYVSTSNKPEWLARRFIELADSSVDEAASVARDSFDDGTQSLLPPALFVWDFDQTVLSIHAYSRRIVPEDVPHRNWSGEVADFNLFTRFVQCVTSTNGLSSVNNSRAFRPKANVAVASFGRKDVILAYLHQIFPPDGFPFRPELIATPVWEGCPEGTCLPDGKVSLLVQLCCRSWNLPFPSTVHGDAGSEVAVVSSLLTDVQKRRVIFFDDDAFNISACRKAGFVNSFHVPRGFASNQLRDILADDVYKNSPSDRARLFHAAKQRNVT